MPNCHDDDDENIIGDRVEDAVITDPNTQAGAASQSAGGWRARIACQQCNGALQAPTDRPFEFAQGTNGLRS